MDVAAAGARVRELAAENRELNFRTDSGTGRLVMRCEICRAA